MFFLLSVSLGAWANEDSSELGVGLTSEELKAKIEKILSTLDTAPSSAGASGSVDTSDSAGASGTPSTPSTPSTTSSLPNYPGYNDYGFSRQQPHPPNQTPQDRQANPPPRAGLAVQMPIRIQMKTWEWMDRSNIMDWSLEGHCIDGGTDITIQMNNTIIKTVPCINGWWVGDVTFLHLYRKLNLDKKERRLVVLVYQARNAGETMHMDWIQPLYKFYCPPNYHPVPSLAGYTKEPFCVAKYEMREDSMGNAVSRPHGEPFNWVKPIAAHALCQGIGYNNKEEYGGRKDLLPIQVNLLEAKYRLGEYDLISNDEWQTLARNMEGVASNWSGGAVGSGSLNVGFTTRGRSPEKGGIESSSDDNDPCFQTGYNCSATTWHMSKRTNVTSIGDTFWDLGGNLEEAVKGEHRGINHLRILQISKLNDVDYPEKFIFGGVKPNEYPKVDLFPLHFIVTISRGTPARTLKEHFGPQGDYTHLGKRENYGGLGLFYNPNYPEHINDLGEIVRGKPYYAGQKRTGIFATTIRRDFSSYAAKGFRCIYRPGLNQQVTIPRSIDEYHNPKTPTKVDVPL